MKALLALLVLTLPAPGQGQASAPPGRRPGSRRSGAAEVVRSAVEAAARAVAEDPGSAGLSIGVVKGGQTYTYHYGSVERGRTIAPNDRTLYAIGSITKTFTGALLAQAAVEGRVRLEADVRTYLSGAYPGLEFQGRPILLHQLLSHRSGLPFVLPETSPEKAGEVLRGQTKAAFLEHLRGVTLATAPGTAFRYSNAGAQLLGYVLEDLSSVSYEELLKRRITRPLGMVDTAIALTPGQRERFPDGYDGQGRVAPHTPDELQGAGALRSTLADMMKYTQWQVAERDPAVKLSHRPTFGEGDYSVGLNWQMLRSGERRLIWQEGHLPGFLAYCVALPELHLGVAVLANAEDAKASSRIAAMINRITSALDPQAVALP